MTSRNVEHTVRVVPGEDSEYKHYFGGDPIHEGAKFRGAENPLHLVYCLNLADPALAAITKIPSVQWLPLYFGFQFDACQFGYLVQSDNRIDVYHDTQQFVDDFPYENYPPVFPRTPVRMEPLGYEEKKILAFAHLLTEDCDFDLEQMSETDRDLLRSWGYPFTQIGGFQRLMQGPPSSPCPNPSCELHGQAGAMGVLATVWNHPIRGWG